MMGVDRRLPGPAGKRLEAVQRRRRRREGVVPSDDGGRGGRRRMTAASPDDMEDFDEDFASGAWVRLVVALGLSAAHLAASAHCVRQVAKTRGDRMPLLAVLVKTVNLATADAFVVLKDQSGEIEATIHSKVLDSLPAQLTPGTALIVRDVR